ncbi:acyltransferase family protein [Acinetobacter shaoyimingii]|uniref:Acyltransferase n=1 Tax=Acinetobacter shaoyimingii TaxID=2715164 RepID=A0A6G8RZQ1_9GAMM|nr:acyltransferase [Acinetobacter shaoyimingii]NHB59407.1 acyltransferase [Acinetobacter shaoyimingii]QIO07419.1 acyltransferase [Acinetobacter shaoyimingii]
MRNYQIDVLRGIAILLVLIHHFNIPYKLNDTFLGVTLGEESLITLIARNGNYGVTMFFVISGFLITQNILRRHNALNQVNLKEFYIRRIARIMPCLVLLVLLVTILGAMGLAPFMNQAPNGIDVSYELTLFSAFTFWMNILIIEYGWVNYALGVLWSLSVEEIFYLVFPILCLTLGKGKALPIFLLAIVMYAPYFRFLHFGAESGAYLYHYFSSFDGIAIGCLSALFIHHFNHKIHIARWWAFVIALFMVGLYLYAPIKQVSVWGISLFAFLTALLILAWSQPKQSNQQSFCTRTLVWIGKSSYEMYLFHLIILGLMKVLYLPKETIPIEKLMLLPIYFISVFILSGLIEKFYSNPLNLKIRQKFLKDE